MSNSHDYGEYPGGYTTEYPPHWARPLLEMYSDLTIEECGYIQGGWARFSFDIPDGGRGSVQFNRAITNAIQFENGASGEIRTGVFEKNVMERDVQIGEVLQARFSGFDSFADALKENSTRTRY